MAIGVDRLPPSPRGGLRVALSDAASLLFARDDALVASARFEDPIDLRSDAAVLLSSWHLDGRRDEYRLLNEPARSRRRSILLACPRWSPSSNSGRDERVRDCGTEASRTSPSASPPTPSSSTWPGRALAAGGGVGVSRDARHSSTSVHVVALRCVLCGHPIALVATLFLLSSTARPRVLCSGLAAACVVTAYLLQTIDWRWCC
jgi:hypothetical protein